MLAQNFKTAAELQITEKEFNALVSLMGMLERGELEHNIDIKSDIYGLNTIYDRHGRIRFDIVGFNMSSYFSKASCGTVACIAGSCDAFFGTDFVRKSNPPRS